jgi:hypothetical protein
LAGEVVAVGVSVTRFAVGDEVYARPDKNRIGTFAELIAIHQDDVAAKPTTLTMEEAASIPLVGLTSWQALVERANLQPGQKVLIHAGSGGVGTIAIQLAKHLGASVATTTSTANIDLVRGLGADVVVDYKKQAFETILHDQEVVLDTLGGETLDKSFQVLKPGRVPRRAADRSKNPLRDRRRHAGAQRQDHRALGSGQPLLAYAATQRPAHHDLRTVRGGSGDAGGGFGRLNAPSTAPTRRNAVLGRGVARSLSRHRRCQPSAPARRTGSWS